MGMHMCIEYIHMHTESITACRMCNELQALSSIIAEVTCELHMCIIYIYIHMHVYMYIYIYTLS